MSLKFGYSTGACATALAVAAWRRLATGSVPAVVTVTFGDDTTRDIAVSSHGDWCCVLKDGGDDPDCTHGATLVGRMSAFTTPDNRDYKLCVGAALVTVRAVEGIGLCTRPGLDCDPGKWAVNIGPRRMMTEHLSREDMPADHWLFELGIRDGERLAEKTLNRQLGVVGGLSVLGTTGLVRPFSHEAYIATVRLCARSWAQEGGTHLVLCTGGRTRKAAEALLGLPENASTCIGDFIAESLEAAQTSGMVEVTVACMAGKLCKYAAGFTNTHAHKVPQDMALLCREAATLYPDADLYACASVREALLLLPDAVQDRLLRRLAVLALQRFREHAPGLMFHLLVCDFTGKPLFYLRDTDEQKGGGLCA